MSKHLRVGKPDKMVGIVAAAADWQMFDQEVADMPRHHRAGTLGKEKQVVAAGMVGLDWQNPGSGEVGNSKCHRLGLTRMVAVAARTDLAQYFPDPLVSCKPKRQ